MKRSVRAAAMLLALALAGGSAMTGTAEVISGRDDREIAAFGTDESNAPIWSTSIAAYQGQALMAYVVRPSDSGGQIPSRPF